MIKDNTRLDIKEVFGAGGFLSQSFSGFEERPQQLEMACAVQQGLSSRRHLVVEAGTGVGKSFAYLVPAIELVHRGKNPIRNFGTGKTNIGNRKVGKGKTSNGAGKVLISTFTITLQEQLTNKDIPFLRRCSGHVLTDCLPNQFTPLEKSQAKDKPVKNTSDKQQKKRFLTGFTAALAKGRGNYLCRRRLEFALRRQSLLFDRGASELAMINNWVKNTTDGSLSSLDFAPSTTIWDAVNSEHGNCRSRKCTHFHNCFYWRARRHLDSADIIVANHALLFSDLVLKEQGASVLPDYKYIIIDEAQNIEHVAEEHFGIDISNYRVTFLLNGLYNPRTHKGLLAYTKADKAIDLLGLITKESGIFFKQVRSWYENNKDETNGRCYVNFVDNNLSGNLNNLRSELSKLAKNTEDVDEKFEILRFADRCAVLAEDINCFILQKRPNYVYWVEVNTERKATIRLKSAALNVGEDVKRCLFDRYESVIMTSATLSSGPAEENIYRKEHGERRENVKKMDSCLRRNDNIYLTKVKIKNLSELSGKEGGFDFFAGRIGLEDFDALKLGSPFDYEKQVIIYIERDLPDPNEPDFIEKATDALKKYILQTKGRAFVLFTSYEMLNDIAERLADWLTENNIELLQQGAGIDRTVLLERFKGQNKKATEDTEKKINHELTRADTNKRANNELEQIRENSRQKSAVLFGTDSFWQGVDVPGEALSNVIIVRLPFAVPDKPLIAGRLEQIKEQSGNPFYEYQLPSAIIKFKQGFGRLIRSKSDTGIVVILDSRIVNKPYGQRFLDAIPKCRTKIVTRRP